MTTSTKLITAGWLLGLAVPLATHSCSSAPEPARLQVTRGQVTQAHPAVVQLEVSQRRGAVQCTGTFVTKTLLLTAAHCFDGPQGNQVRVNGVQALSYTTHPRYKHWLPGYVGSDNFAFDLAVVRFAPVAGRPTLPVSTTRARVGAPALVVGYGATDIHTAAGDGRKRVGTTLITDHAEGHYVIEGAADSSPRQPAVVRHASIGLGDSGGPLLTADGRHLLGVASSAGVGARGPEGAFGIFPDLLTPSSQSFLRQTGVLPGLTRN